MVVEPSPVNDCDTGAVADTTGAIPETSIREFDSGATVNDIQIVDAITASRIKAQGYIVTSDTFDFYTTNLKSK